MASVCSRKPISIKYRAQRIVHCRKLHYPTPCSLLLTHPIFLHLFKKNENVFIGDNAAFQFPFNYVSVWQPEAMNMKNTSAVAFKLYLLPLWRLSTTTTTLTEYILQRSLRNLYFIIIVIHMAILYFNILLYSKKEQYWAKFIIQYVNCILLCAGI